METLFSQDIWGDANPQHIYDAKQTDTALLTRDKLVKLPSGKVMVESEFKLFDSIMKSIPTQVAIIPQIPQNQTTITQPVKQFTPTQVNSLDVQLNQKGILLLAVIFAGTLFTTISLIRVWGTTDIAQQQAYQERIDNQYNEIGKRYDRLAKATEKLGKKSDVCVSFYCGGNKPSDDLAESPDNDIKPSSYRTDSLKSSEISFDAESIKPAIAEITKWKRNGTSRNDAIAYMNWIRKNQSSYPIDYALMKQAFNDIY
jgi:hypothetical protein